MKIKRVVADIVIDWVSDNGKSAGSLRFNVAEDVVCGLADLPGVVAKAVGVPVASMIPPPVEAPVAPPPQAQQAPEQPAVAVEQPKRKRWQRGE